MRKYKFDFGVSRIICFYRSMSGIHDANTELVEHSSEELIICEAVNKKNTV